MALEVAVRNPERYDGILKVFSKFDGQVLDDEGILEVYAQLYIDGVVVTRDIDIPNTSKREVEAYVRTRSHNNEWGFPTGYQSGFTRYLKTLSEFGFIYSQYGQPLRLSPVAKAVVSGKITLSESFALQSMRFWRMSPYRRVLNDFNYFKFILEVIQKLNNASHRLSYNQFMLSLFSDDGDVDNFINLIENNTLSNQDDVYNIVLSMYHQVDTNHSKVCKKKTSFNDYGNTVFRVLQLTGFITVEYEGIILLSINSNQQRLLSRLLDQQFSISENAKEEESQYFNEIGSLSTHLLSIIESNRDYQRASVAGYNTKLPRIIDSYGLTETMIAQYLKDVSEGKNDNNLFWFLQAPLKFEFLLSLYLYICLGDEYEYKPNYICDEAGIPYSHAPGNIGDIEVFNQERYWLIEATLIKGKIQQVNNETINLFRHLDETHRGAKYLSLVAPFIHDDTELLIKVAAVVSMLESKSLIFAKPYHTNNFIESMSKRMCLNEIRNYTNTFILDLDEKLHNMSTTIHAVRHL